MPLIVEKREWIPHTTGTFVAKISLPKQLDTKYGKRLMWAMETGEKDDDGNELAANLFTGLTLTHNSKLTELIEVATGKALAELPKRFDVESIVGTQIQILVVHTRKDDGSVQDKIQAIFPLPPQPGKVEADEDTEDTALF